MLVDLLFKKKKDKKTKPPRCTPAPIFHYYVNSWMLWRHIFTSQHQKATTRPFVLDEHLFERPSWMPRGEILYFCARFDFINVVHTLELPVLLSDSCFTLEEGSKCHIFPKKTHCVVRLSSILDMDTSPWFSRGTRYFGKGDPHSTAIQPFWPCSTLAR